MKYVRQANLPKAAYDEQRVERFIDGQIYHNDTGRGYVRCEGIEHDGNRCITSVTKAQEDYSRRRFKKAICFRHQKGNYGK